MAMETSRPSKEYQDVLAFHQKFKQLCPNTVGHLTAVKLRQRIDFMQEELDEFSQASAGQDLAGQADALVDLVYVAIGTAVQLGLPWDQLWDDVQRANMAKEVGVTKRGYAHDVCKPPGWEGPRTKEVLASNGYQVSQWFRAHSPNTGYPTYFIVEKARDDATGNE